MLHRCVASSTPQSHASICYEPLPKGEGTVVTEPEPRIVIFTCNWNAHESLQAAGKRRISLPARARPLKVDCLGQVGSSVILKAFEKGADGVMLVGCAPEECHYEFGSRRAAELFEEVAN